jgi:hypothetical protein
MCGGYWLINNIIIVAPSISYSLANHTLWEALLPGEARQHLLYKLKP